MALSDYLGQNAASQDYELAKRLYAMQQQGSALNGLASISGGIAAQQLVQAYLQPQPQPEPNKVLLLLGDDE